MASGFVQRWKGKGTFDASSLWIAGSPMYGGGSVQTLSTASATALITNGPGIAVIASSSAIFTYRLAAPSFASAEKTIQMTVSSGIFITVSTNNTVGINGQSSVNTIKSTQNTVLVLEATSTTNWAITSVYPGSTLVSSVLTLSTST